MRCALEERRPRKSPRSSTAVPEGPRLPGPETDRALTSLVEPPSDHHCCIFCTSRQARRRTTTTTTTNKKNNEKRGTSLRVIFHPGSVYEGPGAGDGPPTPRTTESRRRQQKKNGILPRGSFSSRLRSRSPRGPKKTASAGRQGPEALTKLRSLLARPSLRRGAARTTGARGSRTPAARGRPQARAS